MGRTPGPLPDPLAAPVEPAAGPGSVWFGLGAIEPRATQDWASVLGSLPWPLFDRLAVEYSARWGALSVRVGLLSVGALDPAGRAAAKRSLARILWACLPGYHFAPVAVEQEAVVHHVAEVVGGEDLAPWGYRLLPLGPAGSPGGLLRAVTSRGDMVSFRILIARTHLEPAEAAFFGRSEPRGSSQGPVVWPEPAFEVRILLATEEPIDPNLLAASEHHFAGPTPGGKPGHPRILRPLTEADRLAALRAWAGAGDEGWAPTLAPAGLARVRHLLPRRAAAALLRLPEAADVADLPLLGISLRLSRAVRPFRRPAEAGLRLGFTGDGAAACLRPEDRLRHLYVVGQTGTGKSTLLEHLARQDLREGRGVVVIDPHGDLAERLLGAIPVRRLEEVVYFDAGEAEYPIGLNLFDAQSPEERAYLLQDLPEIFYGLFDPERTGIVGPFFEHLLRGAALTLTADPERPGTIADIPRLFLDPSFRAERIADLSDPLAREFWREYALTSDSHRSEYLGWFLSKFDRFRTNPLLRGIVGQPRTPFSLREVMDEGGIFIANLSIGRIGQVNASMLGMFLVLKFQAAAMGRAALPSEGRRPVHLYVDEFQTLTTTSFAELLAGGRKYGVAATLANQYVSQLPPASREAALGTVGSLLVFRCGPADAGLLAPRLAPAFEPTDLMYLPRFTAAASLLAEAELLPPFTLTTEPPHPVSVEWAEMIREASRRRFGRHRRLTEEDLGCV